MMEYVKARGVSFNSEKASHFLQNMTDNKKDTTAPTPRMMGSKLLFSKIQKRNAMMNEMRIFFCCIIYKLKVLYIYKIRYYKNNIKSILFIKNIYIVQYKWTLPKI